MHHLVALLLLSPALAIQRLSHEEQFLRFKQKFAKVYSSEAEERLRFAVFKENVAAVEEHNAGVSTYTKGVNEWSDLRQEEWEAMFLGVHRCREDPAPGRRPRGPPPIPGTSRHLWTGGR